MTPEGLLLIISWLLPLVLGLLHLLYRSRAMSLLAGFAAVPGLLAALFVPIDTVVDLPAVLLGTQFVVDDTGRIFLLFTSVLWLFAGLFAFGYLREDPKRPRFFAFFLSAMAGNLGLIVAGDILTFYLFFALMSFASYGLVVHSQDHAAYYAGRIYIILVMVGEVLLFAALVLLSVSATSLLFDELSGQPISNWVAALLFIGFGIKAGVAFLHMWLPLAHPAAPIPASAVLSGAMIKAGVLGWLRFLQPTEFTVEWGVLLIVVGMFTAFYGAVMGVSQSNPKTVLAYSSISQMGFIIVGVGAWLFSPETSGPALVAVWLYTIHHALAKGALFLGVAFAGMGRIVPLLLVIPAAALAGLPLTSGAVTKAALKTTLDILPGDWGLTLSLPLSVAAFGTTLLMARFLWLIWHSPAAKSRLPGWVWGLWLGLLACVVGLVLTLPDAAEAFTYSLTPASLWTAVAPVIVGSLLGFGVGILAPRLPLQMIPPVPPGDVLGLFGVLWQAMGRALGSFGRWVEQAQLSVLGRFSPLGRLSALGSLTSRLETRMRTDWIFAGSTLLVMALGAMILIWGGL